MLRHLTLGLALCAALTACGGGGSSVSSLPHGPSAAAPAGPQSVTVSIKVPASSSIAGSAAAIRRPLYVSKNTQSAAISVNGQTPIVVNLAAGSSACSVQSDGSRICSAIISAPVATVASPDTFSETLYATTNATGAVLSQGTTTAPIFAGQANVVKLTLSGVIASLSLSTAANPFTLGTQNTAGLIVNFLDASGAGIIGSDQFVTPVALTDTDSSNATAFSAGGTLSSTFAVKSPADAANLMINYNGSTSFTKAVIAASAGNVTAPSLSITPQAATTPQGFNDYKTFGYDNQRSGFNPNSTAITPASVTNLHLAWQSTLGDGEFNSQTQPILATGISGHAGVLFVGGGSGTVYGYDATTGKYIWDQYLGNEQYTCENDTAFIFGVGGTVAYDPNSKSIYAIGNKNSKPNGIAANSLYRIDGGSGAILSQVNFAPPLAGWPGLDFSHTSVTLGSNGLAYVGTAATCDISSWRGRVAAIDTTTIPMTLKNTFFTVWDPNNTRGGGAQPWGGGGIWGWGGVSLDFNGNVLTGVGNTDDGSTTHGSIVAPFQKAPHENSGLGEAFIKLSPDLSTLVDSNQPIPESAYTGAAADLDLQGTPAIFHPNGLSCDPVAALQSKSGALYLFDAAHIGNGPTKQFQLTPGTYTDSFLGGPAYSAATGLLYEAVPTGSDAISSAGMIAINPGCNGSAPSVVWKSSFGADSFASGIPRSVPAVSAGGVIFVGTPCSGSGNCTGSSATALSRTAQGTQRKPLICCAPPSNSAGVLWALDASTGAVLNGGQPIIITSGAIRVPPTIDGNWIFVLDNNGTMYGMTIDPNFKAVASKTRALDPRNLTRWESAPSAP